MEEVREGEEEGGSNGKRPVLCSGCHKRRER
jgi:hypothetical protein